MQTISRLFVISVIGGLMLIAARSCWAETYGLEPVSYPAERTLHQQVCTDLNGDGICDQTGVRLFRNKTVVRSTLHGLRQVVRYEPRTEMRAVTVMEPVVEYVSVPVCPHCGQVHAATQVYQTTHRVRTRRVFVDGQGWWLGKFLGRPMPARFKR